MMATHTHKALKIQTVMELGNGNKMCACVHCMIHSGLMSEKQYIGPVRRVGIEIFSAVYR